MKQRVFHAPRRLAATAVIIACSVAVLSTTAGAAFAAPRSGGETASDPFEPVNRVFFMVNGLLDVVLIRPLAIGYKRILPRPLRTVLHNAVSNLGEPVVAANDILQGHGKKAVRTITRFVGDSTFGIGGLFDVATPAGLPHHGNDFGITLAHYGVTSGPYLFLPILGPTTVRDGIGSIADVGLNPLTYARYPDYEAVGIGSFVVGGLDQRAAQDNNLKTLVASATDVYASLRSFYLQNREAAITGGKIDLETLPSFEDPGGDMGAKPASPTPSTGPKEPLAPIDASAQPAAEPVSAPPVPTAAPAHTPQI
jgi:phospholipid-binding lipoprotein MlaA